MKKTKRTRHGRRTEAQTSIAPERTLEDPKTETPPQLSDGRRRRAAACLSLGLLVAVSYLPTLWNDFVWDDLPYLGDAVLHRWSGLWNIWFSPLDIKEKHYWPVVYTTFWLEHKLWGLEPFGYHVVNLLLHLGNVVLVWRLLLRLAVPGAWAVAAVFAVHPVHVESVAWVMERKDLLSALFYLLAMLSWLRFTEAPRRGRYVRTLGLYVAALLAKSVAVTLPAALILLQWWKRGSVTKRDWLRVAPFFGVGLCITVVDLALYSAEGWTSLGYSPPERLLIACQALWFYVGKLLWPHDLAVIYPLWDVQVGDPVAWLYVITAAVAAVLLWLGRPRLGRGPLAGAAFFAVTLSPTLGFVDFRFLQYSLVADRVQYLASAGVMAALIALGVHAVRTLPRAPALAARGLFIVLLLILGALTWHQSGVYRDDVTLFGHVLESRQPSGSAGSGIALRQEQSLSLVHHNLGRGLMERERFSEAADHFARALQFDRSRKETHNHLGEALRELGFHQRAVEHYRAALALDPDYLLSHLGTAYALLSLHRYEEAANVARQALARHPGSPQEGGFYTVWGQALQRLGRMEAAAGKLERALEIIPDSPVVLLAMAGLRLTQSRFEDSAILFRTVVVHHPDNPQGHGGLGAALFHLEQYEAAMESLARAVSLNPDSPTASASHALMGLSLQGIGRDAAAVAHYEQAVTSDPANTVALGLLARSCLQAARYEEALALYQALLEHGNASAQTHADMGLAQAYLERPAQALQSFERALALDPTLEAARAGLRQLRDVSRRHTPPPE